MKKYLAVVKVHRQDKRGNVYHDVSLYDCSKMELVAELKKVYGYGAQYTVTTQKMIAEMNPRLEKKYPAIHHASGFTSTPVRQAIKAGSMEVVYHLV